MVLSPDHLGVPDARRGRSKCLDRGASLSICSIDGANPGRDVIGGPAVTMCPGAQAGSEVEKSKRRRMIVADERRRRRPKELDGFMLMEACRCELPDQALRVDVSGRGLVSVLEDDLGYFTRLQAVDAGDNTLAFESFARLPQLEELCLPCNSIRDISLASQAYSRLERLDLSYNNLSSGALSTLRQLPSLVDLDLTCNGLTSLPSTMGHLMRLQKLSLERNQLEDEQVIDVSCSAGVTHHKCVYTHCCIIYQSSAVTRALPRTAPSSPCIGRPLILATPATIPGAFPPSGPSRAKHGLQLPLGG